MNMQRNVSADNFFIFALLIIFIFSVDISAQDKPITPEISGFGDVYLSIDENQSDDFDFQIGQFELDIAARLKPHVQIEAAVAYDGEESFEIGVFSYDESTDDDNYRLSLGGGLPLADDCWLRFEYQANSEDSDIGLAQIAVGF